MIYDCNLVFLDFDGVLTAKCNKTYFNPDPEKYAPSDEHVSRLKKLCADTGSKVVIASNWLKFADDGIWTSTNGNSYSNPLPKLRGLLGDLVVDALPIKHSIKKTDALNIWFSSSRLADGKHYVIFDDDVHERYMMSAYQSSYVLVNNELGLNDKSIQAAMKILNGDLKLSYMRLDFCNTCYDLTAYNAVTSALVPLW